MGAGEKEGVPVLAMRAFLFLILLILPSWAAAETLRIDHAVCRYVAVHVPDEDVTYKPGVDQYGKKVVPSDINASPINNMADEIRIKITNDTAKIFDLKVPEIQKGNEKLPLTEPEIEYYIDLKNGVPTLNGKPLEPLQRKQLAVLCEGQKAQDKNR